MCIFYYLSIKAAAFQSIQASFFSHVINNNADIWLMEEKRSLGFWVEHLLREKDWAFIACF